jgi:hypothetical protein
MIEQKEELHEPGKEEEYGYVKQHRNCLHCAPHAEILHPSEKVGAYSRALMGHIVKIRKRHVSSRPLLN